MKPLLIFFLLFACAFYVDTHPFSMDSLFQQEKEVIVKGAVEKEGKILVSKDATIEDVLQEVKVDENADLSGINPLLPVHENDVLSIPYKSEDIQKISINSASKELLQTLPGIGEKTAQNIIDYRNEFGLFQSLEDLMLVKGIGKAKYEKIKDSISL